MRNAIKIIAVNVLVLAGLLLVLEAGAQAVAFLFPSYDVLFLQPDEKLGWKQVPGHKWRWAGHYWYAADFVVDVETNAAGFRDMERRVEKAPGTTRVAVLGDSFIEAVQVPLDGTATQRLDRRLNESGNPAEQWEVLNFGISNFGIGQYLLTWEEHASRYRPDYVAIFVAQFHMDRTVSRYETGAFSATTAQQLWIRPTFRLENGALVREPAADFAKFVSAQEQLLAGDFGPDRTRRKPLRMISKAYVGKLLYRARDLVRGNAAGPPRAPLPPDDPTLMVNLAIIEELGTQVQASGARFAVIDISEFFNADPLVPSSLKQLSAKHGFAYLPISQTLRARKAEGVPTSWEHDDHFNETGNEILADALFQWIRAGQPGQPQS